MAGEAVGPQEFEADLAALGYRFMQEGRTGVRQYALTVTRFLSYWVHWDPRAQTVLFTWEHAIGDYLDGIELQVGSNEPLNQFMFPKFDARGPQDIAFVVREMDRTEQMLRSIDLLFGD